MWVVSVVDRVEKGQPVEDQRVELKRELPEPAAAARRIAAHANAAGGEQILWIIGLDEDEGIVGAVKSEASDWYSQVRSNFDELAPEVTMIDVPIKGNTLTALLFETTRSPFVVKNPKYGHANGGPVELEVPWREVAATRSARRSDLLRVLGHHQPLPTFEFLQGHLVVYPGLTQGSMGEMVHEDPDHYTWKLTIAFYVTPRTNSRAVIPIHQCEASFHFPEHLHAEVVLSSLELKAPSTWHGGSGKTHSDSNTITSTRYEAQIDGPGVLILKGSQDTPRSIALGDSVCVKTRFRAVHSSWPISLPLELSKDDSLENKPQKNVIARWLRTNVPLTAMDFWV